MRFILAATLAVALAACGGDPSSNPSTLSDIDTTTASGTWQTHAIDSYEVTLTRDCFCLPRGAIVLTVKNGQLQESLVVEENRALTTEEAAYIPTTIDQLFELIESSQTAGETVTAEYDNNFGFPTRVAINEAALAADGGIIYHLTNFVPQE